MSVHPEIQAKANLLRYLCLKSTSKAGSGHPSSCLSAVDIMTVLFDKYFNFYFSNSESFLNDRIVFSKGHCAPLLYALFGMSGAYPLSDLGTLRQFGSPFEGHPTPNFSYAQAATGSLGQGLSVGAGLALGIRKKLQNLNLKSQIPKVYVLLGDGEMAEGQNWEALNFASYYELTNLVPILDVNGLGQSQKTMFKDVSEYERRFESFGFETLVIDGHDFVQIEDALSRAMDSARPVAIIAQTIKGKGVSLLEGKEGWHGKALTEKELEKAISELSPINESLRFDLQKINQETPILSGGQQINPPKLREISARNEDQHATREAYGQALVEIGKEDLNIIVIDGDVKNSTFTESFAKSFPDRFIEGFIAEQNMISVAVGLSRLSYMPIVSTFASFLVRASDQIRMAAISRSTIHFNGSHAGVSIGEDGPSQMGLEDISLFGSLPDSVIVQPSDVVSMKKILPQLLSLKGITYVRTLRPKTPALYSDSEIFSIGGSKVIRHSNDDLLTILATGITVHEAVKAADELSRGGIQIRVVDCYSIRPLDVDTISACLESTTEKILITVEDHYRHGGFGDFVLDAFSDGQARIVKLCVDEVPRSGSMKELIHEAKIDNEAIMSKVREVVGSL